MVKPYVGQVEANSASSVSFPTAGTIKRIYVDEGQRVNKGQLLVEIDPMILQKALQSAEALFSQAQDAYERMKFLHDNNSLPEIQWVETQSRLSQAQSAYDIARKNLADSRLLAPISGVIGRKFAQTGETVMPAQTRDDRTRHKQGKSECIHSGERDRWHTRGYGVRRVRRGSRRGFVQGRTYREERTERPHDAYISHQHSRGQSRRPALAGNGLRRDVRADGHPGSLGSHYRCHGGHGRFPLCLGRGKRNGKAEGHPDGYGLWRAYRRHGGLAGRR